MCALFQVALDCGSSLLKCVCGVGARALGGEASDGDFGDPARVDVIWISLKLMGFSFP